MTGEAPFRWILAGELLAAIAISGFYRRRARLSGEAIPRRRETGLFILARLAFALPLLLGLVAFIARPGLIAWARVPLPSAVRWAGVTLGLLCLPLLYRVMTSIGDNISETVLTKREHELVTHGPYRWIRHPLYTTGLLLLAAATLISANGFIGAVTVAGGIMIRLFIIPAEEAALIAKFGERYREYIRTTGGLLPRL